MSDITLSKAVRSNLLSLQNTADMMATTQNRLATGNKVNSALDNPTNFFTASSLNSRAGDINQLMDSMANGIQTIEAADNGLTAITKTLESMQSTLRQARQDKSFETGSFTLGEDASGKISLSGGSLQGTHEINLNKAQAESVTSGAVFKVQGSTGADALTGTEYTAAAVTAADPLEFSVQGNNDAATIDISIDDTTEGVANAATGPTLSEVVAITNEKLDVAGSSIRARENDGALEFYDTDASNVGAAATITITGTDAATLGFDAAAPPDPTNVSAGADATDYSFTISNQEDGSDPITVNLNGDRHDTVEKAVAEINKQLRAGGVEDLSASVKDGRISLSGPADGTAAHIEIDGTDADHFFGTANQRTETTASTDGGAQKTVDELVAEINSNTSGISTSVRASNDNGKLRIENLSTTELDVDGVSSLGEIDGESSGASSIGGNSVRAGLAEQYNELRDQLDKLADDASFNGINLLRGDNLQITFNETGTSELNIRSKDGESINSGTLGIMTNMEASDLDSDANIDDMLASVKTAINEVRSQSSAFGSSLSIVENRQDFSKNMINTLQTGAGNLTLADSNQEAANLLALQTRQQLSSTALSMASQADQAVLRLF